ncbi:hypothetical protein GCM10009608_74010 [Pseudonocardia alaniniphila]|nr:hypothetical protein [Pseudonocardia alaniniphila]
MRDARDTVPGAAESTLTIVVTDSTASAAARAVRRNFSSVMSTAGRESNRTSTTSRGESR